MNNTTTAPTALYFEIESWDHRTCDEIVLQVMKNLSSLIVPDGFARHGDCGHETGEFWGEITDHVTFKLAAPIRQDGLLPGTAVHIIKDVAWVPGVRFKTVALLPARVDSTDFEQVFAYLDED